MFSWLPPYRSKEIPVNAIIPLRLHAALPETQARVARAEIVSPQFLGEFLVVVDDSTASLDTHLRRIPFPALAHAFKSANVLAVLISLTWRTSTRAVPPMHYAQRPAQE
jgi:hypothetical protein